MKYISIFEEFKKDYRSHLQLYFCYIYIMNCRLKPSNIKNAGVGVFSISTIEKRSRSIPRM